jgi:hypothetical protein
MKLSYPSPSLILIALACVTHQTLRAENYALLFSGGYDSYNNWDRYYAETSRMWNLLTNYGGYAADNVYVLFADGDNPYQDQHSSETEEYSDSDWSMVSDAGGVIRPATRLDFIGTVQEIGDRMASGEDSFYFWSFDHGAQDDDPAQGSGALVAWNMDPVLGVYETSWDDVLIKTSEISALLDPITSMNPLWEAYVMTQCYAGDFLYGLGITETDTNRFFAYAAAWDEESYDHAFADAWADGLELGLTTTQALGAYAVHNDIYGEYQGEYWETPGYIGGNFVMSSIPEPSAIWFGAGAGLALAFMRRKRS